MSDRSIQSLATNDLVCSIQLRGPNANKGAVWLARHTHRAKSTQLEKSVLTATKRDPEQFRLAGFYRLLPQLVGSCDPGGAGLGIVRRPD
jgi:hypothetical protein